MKALYVSIKSKFFVWLMQTRPYLFFLRYVVPEITIVHAPGPSYFIKQQIKTMMKPGDILISKSTYRLTNLIIGGKFSHGAVVVAKNKIAEMTANDFDVVGMDHFALGCTRIALLRFKDPPANYGQRVARKAMAYANKKYDAQFTLGVEALYCSELAYQSDFLHKMQADLSDLVGMGRPYISPDGIYSAPGLKIVYEWKDEGW